LILDNPDPMNDRQLARHITAMYATGPEALSAEIMPPELLARYISYAREHIHPVITDTAAEALVHAYMELRQFGGSRKTIAATPRQLESLIRISEALARMRFSSEVALGDVAEALRLIKTALCQSVTDPVTGMVDMSIITTGLSESSRQRLNQSVVSLRDYLSHRRIGAPLRLRALLEEYNQQNNANLQMHQLRDICRSLVEEGFISYNSRQDAISLIY
jgi:DNA replication licensing factor MCM4